MVRLFVVLGLVLLAGGAYAIVDGWPYLVLERGFTEVILGALAAIAGLILLALAAVLAEVRRLKGLVSGAMAVAALSEPRAEERPAPSLAPARPEPAFENVPASETGHIGIATTLAAGTGAAVAAGALAGLAKTEGEPDAKPADKANDSDKAEESDDTRSDRAETVAAEPSQLPPAAAGDIDDWLLPPAAPVLDAAPADVRPDELSGHGEADEKIESTPEKPEPVDLASTEEVSQPGDERIDGAAEDAAVAEDKTEAEQAEDESDEAFKPETAPASNADDRPWWPRIDRPAGVATASVDDEFSALRDQLTGVVNAPEIEPPRRDRDVPAAGESWIAPRPWPPVTQPRDPVALSEIEAEAVDKTSPEEARAEAAPRQPDEPEAAEPESEPQEEDAQEPASAAADMPPAEEAGPSIAEMKSDEEPAASEEGVIGAYQVGETQFTMFADGSIHARTPDGDYTFASMDELKAYLASEKDKLEPSSS